jgi:hypothetical protein
MSAQPRPQIPQNKAKNPPQKDRENASSGHVAEGTGLGANLLLWMPLGLQGISDQLSM